MSQTVDRGIDWVSADVPVHEIRDYARINAEVARLLDNGERSVSLKRSEGQRLLLSKLVGVWEAVIEVDGDVGPEFAAELAAPGLRILVRGNAADGLCRGLVEGAVLVSGNAADAAGYVQSGGTVAIARSAGHRLGLMLAGGTLLAGGSVGRLAGERQSGGRIVLDRRRVGPNAGRAKSSGERIELDNGWDASAQEIAALALAPFPIDWLSNTPWSDLVAKASEGDKT